MIKYTVTTIVLRMAHAIMEFEGYKQGSLSYRNHNPGNVKAAGQPGVVGKDPQGHAVFVNFEAGWDVLINQLTMMFDGRSRVYNREMSLLQVFQRYAEANSEIYASFVARRLEAEPTTKLKDLVRNG